MGYVRLWNGHQSKDANNRDVFNCKREVKAQQEHCALVEMWVRNVRAFPVLSCVVWRFMIY